MNLDIRHQFEWYLEVEYVSGTASEFSICGTTSGDAVACEIDPSPCTVDIDGLQHSSFTLDGTNTREIFCVAPNSGFQIRQIDNVTTSVRVTCKFDQISPPWTNLTFTGLDRKNFESEDDCDLISCD